MKNNSTLEPPIRFPDFKEPWETKAIERVLKRRSMAVEVEPETLYSQIGLRSHGKGVFHKEPVTGKSLGNKRVFWIQPDCLVLNIVFAWEQAVGRTTKREDGFIASHRFPMYAPKDGEADIDFIVRFFLRPRGKRLLGLASPGGAGRNRTLGQKEFDKLRIILPALPEQRKIAAFLTAVDGRIQQLIQKQALLEDYKKGVMQQLFTQALRFKDDQGGDFPNWEEKTLGEVGSFSKGKGISKAEVAEDGATPCVRYGELYTLYSEVIMDVRSRTNVPTSELVLSAGNDVIIPASGETHIDIATASCVMKPGVALGGDLNIIRTQQNGVFLAYYLNSAHKHAIASVAQGSSVIHLYADQLKRLNLTLPSVGEQTKIADFLSAVDRNIDRVITQIIQTETFKKGLLQQMFV
jgi:type I restriction enzyme S subunit